MGVPRNRCLHRLQLCSRPPGAYLCGIGFSLNVAGGKFPEVGKRKQIRRLPLPPARRRQPHLGSSLCPCATPPAKLALPCPSAQRKCERQPRRGSRCLLECPLFRVRPALHPTAVPPAPLLRALQRRRQSPLRGCYELAQKWLTNAGNAGSAVDQANREIRILMRFLAQVHDTL